MFKQAVSVPWQGFLRASHLFRIKAELFVFLIPVPPRLLKLLRSSGDSTNRCWAMCIFVSRHAKGTDLPCEKPTLYEIITRNQELCCMPKNLVLNGILWC